LPCVQPSGLAKEPLQRTAIRNKFTTIFDCIVVASDGVGSNLRRRSKRPTASDQNEKSLRHGLINGADRQKHGNRGSARFRAPSFCSVDPMGFAAGW
jgi:hypothetical protein